MEMPSDLPIKREHKRCDRPGRHDRHSWVLIDDDDNPISDWYLCEGAP